MEGRSFIPRQEGRGQLERLRPLTEWRRDSIFAMRKKMQFQPIHNIVPNAYEHILKADPRQEEYTQAAVCTELGRGQSGDENQPFENTSSQNCGSCQDGSPASQQWQPGNIRPVESSQGQYYYQQQEQQQQQQYIEQQQQQLELEKHGDEQEVVEVQQDLNSSQNQQAQLPKDELLASMSEEWMAEVDGKDLFRQCQFHLDVINACTDLQQTIKDEMKKQAKLDNIIYQRMTAKAQRLHQQAASLKEVQVPKWAPVALDELGTRVHLQAQTHHLFMCTLVEQCTAIQHSLDGHHELMKQVLAHSDEIGRTASPTGAQRMITVMSAALGNDYPKERGFGLSFLQASNLFEDIRKPRMKLVNKIEYVQSQLDSTMQILDKVVAQIGTLKKQDENEPPSWRRQLQIKDCEIREEFLESHKEGLESDLKFAALELRDTDFTNRDKLLDILNVFRQHRIRYDTTLRKSFQLLKAVSLGDMNLLNSFMRAHNQKCEERAGKPPENEPDAVTLALEMWGCKPGAECRNESLSVADDKESVHEKMLSPTAPPSTSMAGARKSTNPFADMMGENEGRSQVDKETESRSQADLQLNEGLLAIQSGKEEDLNTVTSVINETEETALECTAIKTVGHVSHKTPQTSLSSDSDGVQDTPSASNMPMDLSIAKAAVTPDIAAGGEGMAATSNYNFSRAEVKTVELSMDGSEVGLHNDITQPSAPATTITTTTTTVRNPSMEASSQSHRISFYASKSDEEREKSIVSKYITDFDPEAWTNLSVSHSTAQNFSSTTSGIGSNGGLAGLTGDVTNTRNFRGLNSLRGQVDVDNLGEDDKVALLINKYVCKKNSSKRIPLSKNFNNCEPVSWKGQGAACAQEGEDRLDFEMNQVLGLETQTRNVRVCAVKPISTDGDSTSVEDSANGQSASGSEPMGAKGNARTSIISCNLREIEVTAGLFTSPKAETSDEQSNSETAERSSVDQSNNMQTRAGESRQINSCSPSQPDLQSCHPQDLDDCSHVGDGDTECKKPEQSCRIRPSNTGTLKERVHSEAARTSPGYEQSKKSGGNAKLQDVPRKTNSGSNRSNEMSSNGMARQASSDRSENRRRTQADHSSQSETRIQDEETVPKRICSAENFAHQGSSRAIHFSTTVAPDKRDGQDSSQESDNGLKEASTSKSSPHVDSKLHQTVLWSPSSHLTTRQGSNLMNTRLNNSPWQSRGTGYPLRSSMRKVSCLRSYDDIGLGRCFDHSSHYDSRFRPMSVPGVRILDIFNNRSLGEERDILRYQPLMDRSVPFMSHEQLNKCKTPPKRVKKVRFDHRVQYDDNTERLDIEESSSSLTNSTSCTCSVTSDYEHNQNSSNSVGTKYSFKVDSKQWQEYSTLENVSRCDIDFCDENRNNSNDAETDGATDRSRGNASFFSTTKWQARGEFNHSERQSPSTGPPKRTISPYLKSFKNTPRKTDKQSHRSQGKSIPDGWKAVHSTFKSLSSPKTLPRLCMPLLAKTNRISQPMKHRSSPTNVVLGQAEPHPGSTRRRKISAKRSKRSHRRAPNKFPEDSTEQLACFSPDAAATENQENNSNTVQHRDTLLKSTKQFPEAKSRSLSCELLRLFERYEGPGYGVDEEENEKDEDAETASFINGDVNDQKIGTVLPNIAEMDIGEPLITSTPRKQEEIEDNVKISMNAKDSSNSPPKRRESGSGHSLVGVPNDAFTAEDKNVCPIRTVQRQKTWNSQPEPVTSALPSTKEDPEHNKDCKRVSKSSAQSNELCKSSQMSCENKPQTKDLLQFSFEGKRKNQAVPEEELLATRSKSVPDKTLPRTVRSPEKLPHPECHNNMPESVTGDDCNTDVPAHVEQQEQWPLNESTLAKMNEQENWDSQSIELLKLFKMPISKARALDAWLENVNRALSASPPVDRIPTPPMKIKSIHLTSPKKLSRHCQMMQRRQEVSDSLRAVVHSGAKRETCEGIKAHGRAPLLRHGSDLQRTARRQAQHRYSHCIGPNTEEQNLNHRYQDTKQDKLCVRGLTPRVVQTSGVIVDKSSANMQTKSGPFSSENVHFTQNERPNFVTTNDSGTFCPFSKHQATKGSQFRKMALSNSQQPIGKYISSPEAAADPQTATPGTQITRLPSLCTPATLHTHGGLSRSKIGSKQLVPPKCEFKHMFQTDRQLLPRMECTEPVTQGRPKLEIISASRKQGRPVIDKCHSSNNTSKIFATCVSETREIITTQRWLYGVTKLTQNYHEHSQVKASPACNAPANTRRKENLWHNQKPLRKDPKKAEVRSHKMKDTGTAKSYARFRQRHQEEVHTLDSSSILYVQPLNRTEKSNDVRRSSGSKRTARPENHAVDLIAPIEQHSHKEQTTNMNLESADNKHEAEQFYWVNRWLASLDKPDPVTAAITSPSPVHSASSLSVAGVSEPETLTLDSRDKKSVHNIHSNNVDQLRNNLLDKNDHFSDNFLKSADEPTQSKFGDQKLDNKCVRNDKVVLCKTTKSGEKISLSDEVQDKDATPYVGQGTEEKITIADQHQLKNNYENTSEHTSTPLVPVLRDRSHGDFKRSQTPDLCSQNPENTVKAEILPMLNTTVPNDSQSHPTVSHMASQRKPSLENKQKNKIISESEICATNTAASEHCNRNQPTSHHRRECVGPSELVRKTSKILTTKDKNENISKTLRLSGRKYSKSDNQEGPLSTDNRPAFQHLAETNNETSGIDLNQTQPIVDWDNGASGHAEKTNLIADGQKCNKGVNETQHDDDELFTECKDKHASMAGAPGISTANDITSGHVKGNDENVRDKLNEAQNAEGDEEKDETRQVMELRNAGKGLWGTPLVRKPHKGNIMRSGKTKSSVVNEGSPKYDAKSHIAPEEENTPEACDEMHLNTKSGSRNKFSGEAYHARENLNEDQTNRNLHLATKDGWANESTDQMYIGTVRRENETCTNLAQTPAPAEYKQPVVKAKYSGPSNKKNNEYLNEAQPIAESEDRIINNGEAQLASRTKGDNKVVDETVVRRHSEGNNLYSCERQDVTESLGITVSKQADNYVHNRESRPTNNSQAVPTGKKCIIKKDPAGLQCQQSNQPTSCISRKINRSPCILAGESSQDDSNPDVSSTQNSGTPQEPLMSNVNCSIASVSSAESHSSPTSRDQLNARKAGETRAPSNDTNITNCAEHQSKIIENCDPMLTFERTTSNESALSSSTEVNGHDECQLNKGTKCDGVAVIESTALGSQKQKLVDLTSKTDEHDFTSRTRPNTDQRNGKSRSCFTQFRSSTKHLEKLEDITESVPKSLKGRIQSQEQPGQLSTQRNDIRETDTQQTAERDAETNKLGQCKILMFLTENDSEKSAQGEITPRIISGDSQSPKKLKSVHAEAAYDNESLYSVHSGVQQVDKYLCNSHTNEIHDPLTFISAGHINDVISYPVMLSSSVPNDLNEEASSELQGNEEGATDSVPEETAAQNDVVAERKPSSLLPATEQPRLSQVSKKSSAVPDWLERLDPVRLSGLPSWKDLKSVMMVLQALRDTIEKKRRSKTFRSKFRKKSQISEGSEASTASYAQADLPSNFRDMQRRLQHAKRANRKYGGRKEVKVGKANRFVTSIERPEVLRPELARSKKQATKASKWKKHPSAPKTTGIPHYLAPNLEPVTALSEDDLLEDEPTEAQSMDDLGYTDGRLKITIRPSYRGFRRATKRRGTVKTWGSPDFQLSQKDHPQHVTAGPRKKEDQFTVADLFGLMSLPGDTLSEESLNFTRHPNSKAPTSTHVTPDTTWRRKTEPHGPAAFVRGGHLQTSVQQRDEGAVDAFNLGESPVSSWSMLDARPRTKEARERSTKVPLTTGIISAHEGDEQTPLKTPTEEAGTPTRLHEPPLSLSSKLDDLRAKYTKERSKMLPTPSASWRRAKHDMQHVKTYQTDKKTPTVTPVGSRSLPVTGDQEYTVTVDTGIEKTNAMERVLQHLHRSPRPRYVVSLPHKGAEPCNFIALSKDRPVQLKPSIVSFMQKQEHVPTGEITSSRSKQKDGQPRRKTDHSIITDELSELTKLKPTAVQHQNLMSDYTSFAQYATRRIGFDDETAKVADIKVTADERKVPAAPNKSQAQGNPSAFPDTHSTDYNINKQTEPLTKSSKSVVFALPPLEDSTKNAEATKLTEPKKKIQYENMCQALVPSVQVDAFDSRGDDQPPDKDSLADVGTLVPTTHSDDDILYIGGPQRTAGTVQADGDGKLGSPHTKVPCQTQPNGQTNSDTRCSLRQGRVQTYENQSDNLCHVDGKDNNKHKTELLPNPELCRNRRDYVPGKEIKTFNLHDLNPKRLENRDNLEIAETQIGAWQNARTLQRAPYPPRNPNALHKSVHGIAPKQTRLHFSSAGGFLRHPPVKNPGTTFSAVGQTTLLSQLNCSQNTTGNLAEVDNHVVPSTLVSREQKKSESTRTDGLHSLQNRSIFIEKV